MCLKKSLNLSLYKPSYLHSLFSDENWVYFTTISNHTGLHIRLPYWTASDWCIQAIHAHDVRWIVMKWCYWANLNILGLESRLCLDSRQVRSLPATRPSSTAHGAIYIFAIYSTSIQSYPWLSGIESWLGMREVPCSMLVRRGIIF